MQYKEEISGNKEQSKGWNESLRREEDNISKKQQEISELESQWNILRIKQENLET